MNAAPVLARLQRRHAELDAELRREMNRPAPDSLLVAALKRRKLRIKDRLKT